MMRREVRLGLLSSAVLGGGSALLACPPDVGDLCTYTECGMVEAGADVTTDSGRIPESGDAPSSETSSEDGGDGAFSDAPSEAGIACDGSAAALVCGSLCVSALDPAHCGSCTNVCPAPAMGGATCTPGADGGPACGISCNSGYHVCNGDCLANTDEPSSGDACVLTESYGVFVTPTGSDAAGCGTRAMPCATIGHAMDVAKGGTLTRVYACGSAGAYTSENLSVGATLGRADGLRRAGLHGRDLDVQRGKARDRGTELRWAGACRRLGAGHVRGLRIHGEGWGERG